MIIKDFEYKYSNVGQYLCNNYLFPKKISQSKLSKELNVSRQCINSIFQGQLKLSKKLAIKIEEITKIKADFLLSLQEKDINFAPKH